MDELHPGMSFARAAMVALAIGAPVFSASCISCLGPSEPGGQCEGSVGATDVTGPMSEESYFKLLRKESCAESDRHQFDMTFADGDLHVLALTDAWSVLQSRDTEHDLKPAASETNPMVHEWRIHAPTDRPALTDGWIGATRGPGGEVQGDFQMAFEDGSSVICSFELPFENERTEGKRTDCGDGGGGGGGGVGGDLDDD